MNKKTYQQPQAKVYALNNQSLLGGTGGADSGGLSRENGTLWDDGGE